MKTKLFIISLALVISLGSIISSAYIARPSTGQAVVPAECQYETRPLINGQCDNSDPACPETLKDPVLHGNCPVAIPQTPAPAPVAPKPGCSQ